MEGTGEAEARKAWQDGSAGRAQGGVRPCLGGAGWEGRCISPGVNAGPGGVGVRASARLGREQTSKARMARRSGNPFGVSAPRTWSLGDTTTRNGGDLRPGRYHWRRERQVAAREYRGLKGVD